MTLRLRLHPSTQRFDQGRLCFGGSPRRIVRLSDSGARLLDELLAGIDAPSPAASALAERLRRAGLAVTVPPPATAETAWGVAVVVPVHNRADDLDRCLTSLAMADRVVVIDDGSIDGAAIIDVTKRHGARLHRSSENRGPAAARNLGLEVVATELPTGRLIAFVDSDVLASEQELLSLAAHFVDPAVSAVAPRVRPQPAENSMIARFLAVASPLDLGADPGLVQPLTPIGHVPTACLLVRRDHLPEPAFDPNLRYGEDVDLVWRLIDNGGLVVFDPTVEVGHREPTTWSSLLRRRFVYGTSAAQLSDRHPARLAPLVFQPTSLVGALGIIAGGPLGWLVGLGGFGIPVGRLRHRLIGLGLPSAAAGSSAIESQTAALRGYGRFATQFLMPLLGLLMWRRPSSRPGVALLVVADPLLRQRRLRPKLDPIRWTIACWADDAAYGAGVIRGAVRHRRPRPLIPRTTTRSGPTSVKK